ncbi:glycosyltransferase family 117 protein [Pontibacter chitinilyticus]|uniref:glycosyltransferase family 117 protein n=1 Tax=Pontibacter chitinilyticus TaxID=2674989 RepID=UPI003219E659
MTDYRKINNIVGWVVFLIAATVYILTLEPTASFWDCGEFIASSYKLLVPHPPGAPLFLLIGRIFSLFASDVTQVAWWVNLLSGLCSAFTVLFLFWTITILAKRLLIKEGELPTTGNIILVMGCGVVGALAYTFSDSAWFSAVEAEVYAMSSFFTAIVFWAMLKWEAKAGEAYSDKWLILIAYLVGLSIGVHLLNLVAIPALAFIYYFRLYKPTFWGGVVAFLISAVVLLTILWGIIPGLPSLAGDVEVFFVNSLGLPFGTGVIVFVVFVIAAIAFGIRYSIQHQNRVLNTALLCLVFVLIGYSSYMMIPIRSSYNPTIDENDPDDILSVVAYLKREQYGDRPLIYGPQYNAQPVDQEEGAPRYVRGKDKYIVAGHKMESIYESKDKVLLPRIYSDVPQHVDEYKKWVDLREGETPTFGQNLSFMFRYQLGHMYWRYFLWNFAGRESDVQNAGVLWFGKGGPNIPERVLYSKARNCFYLLPLLVGILGLIYQLRKKERDAFIIGLLFFFTGIAIALYLNQPPVEPRERDYTFAGSFYAFSIWIGLGVLGVAELIEKVLANKVARASLATVACLSVPIVMGAQGWDDHDRSDRYQSVDSAKNLLDSVAPNGILFTNGDNDTFPLWYVQEVEGYRTDVRVAVLSYLNTDWYIDQMKRPSYKSDPWPLTLENENYRQGTNDYLPYVERPQVKAGIDLKQFIQLVKENHPALQVQYGAGTTLLTMPTHNFFLNVDQNKVRQMGFIPAEKQDEITDRMQWTINKSLLEKKHLIMLDLLSTNNWKRPIYFSTTVNSADFIGLSNYFQLDGLAYRIVPVKTTAEDSQGYVNKDLMYDNMMKKFSFRNFNNPDIFYDENYLRFSANARDKFAELAKAYLKDGNVAKAKEVVDYCFKVMPGNAVPYDYYTPQFIPIMNQIGEQEKAHALLNEMAKDAQQSLDYYFAKGSLFDTEIQTNMVILQQLISMAQDIGEQDKAQQLQQEFMQYLQRMRR